MMSGRPKQPKYARNKNILVIGGSGSGKTRFFVKPNLMQMHSSYVVTDPKGTVLVECGKMLSKNDYRIKVLNTINFAKSMHYNPFAYIRSEKDILKLYLYAYRIQKLSVSDSCLKPAGWREYRPTFCHAVYRAQLDRKSVV